ncbi:MAG TPA: ankyrin repeat domain-containing protein, partial [Phycisphaerae bacterium]|nr:ankyrin repeat domain-containing protein [Phycisphaerae bacterium]
MRRRFPRTTWLTAMLMSSCVIFAVGCREKEPASTEKTSAEPAELSARDQAVLEQMRQQATMPAAPPQPRPPATQPTTATAPAYEPLDNPLLEAARKGDLETVKKLVLSGSPMLVNDLQGVTPVHWAALEGHLDVVRFLIDEMKMKPDERNREGVTPVHWAAFGGHRNVVDYLVSKGADVDVEDNEGRTPL